MKMLKAAAAHEIKDVLLLPFWQYIQSPSGRSVHYADTLVSFYVGLAIQAQILFTWRKMKIYKTV